MKKFLLFLSLLLIITACEKKPANKNMPINIRKPAVVGSFYKADPVQLRADIENYLASSTLELAADAPVKIKAVLVPHAGYDYSAPVAAYSYKAIQGKTYQRVIMISNSHNAYFEGIAIDDSDVWETPLGNVSLDHDFARQLADANRNIKIDREVHKQDHTLEVQLPFLQIALKEGFKIVPILFGNTSTSTFEILAKGLKENLGDDDLIVISSDMSHYPKYEDANTIDKETLSRIVSLDIASLDDHVFSIENKSVPNEETLLCGIDGVKTVMELASVLDWKAEILKYANSGDSRFGEKNRVVGYGAVAFAQVESQKSKVKSDKIIVNKQLDDLAVDNLNNGQKNELLKIARETVEDWVRNKKIPSFTVEDERLSLREGAFVTLNLDGRLRGCIGRFSPTDMPLWKVVRDMAVAASSEDPRFLPVSKEELDRLEYEISVLSVPEKIASWKDIELGRHGVIVKKGTASGVFLPQVAIETGWNKEQFLSELCRQKAGLPSDCYKNDNEVELSVFTAQILK